MSQIRMRDALLLYGSLKASTISFFYRVSLNLYVLLPGFKLIILKLLLLKFLISEASNKSKACFFYVVNLK